MLLSSLFILFTGEDFKVKIPNEPSDLSSTPRYERRWEIYNTSLFLLYNFDYYIMTYTRFKPEAVVKC